MAIDDSILDRYYARLCDEREETEVRRWFTTAEGQAYLSEDMQRNARLWGDDEEGVTDHEIPTVAMFQRIERTIHRRERRMWFLKVAAVLLPLFFAASALLLLVRTPEKEVVTYRDVYVAKGERLQVLLQDGTRIWLNADSRLSYPDNFNGEERAVRLEGEAFFKVAHNPEKPFRVCMGSLAIRVTGTSFNVKAYADDSLIQTCLSEGAIQLQSALLADGRDKAMRPGDVAMFSRRSGACRMDRTDNPDEYSAWKDDRLVFRRTPFGEVIKVLERKFDQKFEVEDSSLYRYSYTITFRQESIREILRALQRITPVRFRFEEGKCMVSQRRLARKSV